jgi:hypothetical protein
MEAIFDFKAIPNSGIEVDFAQFIGGKSSGILPSS